MVILIAGASHTGKTLFAQKLLEKYKYPYLSIDHLKMGLIRSGQTNFTVEDDEQLTKYLWSIVVEMIKTAIENKQNLIVEGCYIPADWNGYFKQRYLEEIKYCCLIMSEEYIKNNFSTIKQKANIIEKRLDDSYCTKELLIKENKRNLEICKQYNYKYILLTTGNSSMGDQMLLELSDTNEWHVYPEGELDDDGYLRDVISNVVLWQGEDYILNRHMEKKLFRDETITHAFYIPPFLFYII